MHPIFKQFRAAEGGCISYLIADRSSRKACVVDPRVDEADLIESFVDQNGLSVALVVDTHTHADHFSATHVVAERFGAPIAMSEHTKSARAAKKLKDGEEVEIGGGLGLQALHTPGHTPDSMSFVLKGEWGQLVLTGDTLFIGGSGRTDFPEADPGAQYESIYTRLGGLDGTSWVLPGHDYSDLLFSTIDHEKRENPHWQFKSRDEFIQMKRNEALESGGVLQNIVNFNLDGAPKMRPRGGAHTMCATVCADAARDFGARKNVEEFRQILGEASSTGALIVDVREPEEFAKSRVEGMVNFPLSELFMRWDELAGADAVYFFCQRGNRSLVAARTARRLGVKNVSDLEGGLISWIAAGKPVLK